VSANSCDGIKTFERKPRPIEGAGTGLYSEQASALFRVPSYGEARSVCREDRRDRFTSAIHSADNRFAPETLELLLKDFPVVSLLTVIVNSDPLKLTVADMLLPGETGTLEMSMEGGG
jgi:hypothetical protein